jgi:hypothetical protein
MVYIHLIGFESDTRARPPLLCSHLSSPIPSSSLLLFPLPHCMPYHVSRVGEYVYRVSRISHKEHRTNSSARAPI